MIAPPARGMDQTPRDPRDEQRVGDLELDRMIDRLFALCEHGVELGRLGDGAGEAVEDEAGPSVSEPDGGGSELAGANGQRDAADGHGNSQENRKRRRIGKGTRKRATGAVYPPAVPFPHSSTWVSFGSVANRISPLPLAPRPSLRSGLGATHPFRHSSFFTNSSLIIPTIISSETNFPESMIFFAAFPKSV